MVWKPHVTVASIIERDHRFLMVEERVAEGYVINQPAGHLDEGETLVEAAIRETLEETAWSFAPEAIVGIYLWRHPRHGQTFLRTCFCGAGVCHHPERGLDADIVRTIWLSREELGAARERLRSPMVLSTIDDYLAGIRYPLALLQSLISSTEASWQLK